MTGAAGILSIGQPAISYQIASLESAVGFPLFTRTKGKLTPTIEGLQLLAEVDRLYEGLSGIEAAARSIADHQRAILRVLMTAPLSSPSIVGAIGRYVAGHPGLRVDIDIAHRTTVIRNVVNGLADIGVVSLPVNTNKVIPSQLFISKLVCVVPDKHPMSRLTCITPNNLTGFSLIAMKPGGVIRPLIDRWFTSAGIAPVFEFEVGDAWAAIELVRVGLGVTIVAQVSAASQIGLAPSPLRMIPLDSIDGIEVGIILPAMDGGNRTAMSLLAFLQAEQLH